MTQPEVPAPAQKDSARRVVYFATGFLVIAVAALVVARAAGDRMDFLGVGWIIVLGLIPLIPWWLPQARRLLKEIAPNIRGFSLAGIGIEFEATQKPPMTLPSAGTLAGLPNDLSAFSTSTHIMDLISALRECRQQGWGPAAVIDLRNGNKWGLRNVYFLAYLLEADEQVEELVFTETRAGTDGYLVGTARPAGFRQKIAQTLPAIGTATLSAPLPRQRDLSDPSVAQETADAFNKFKDALDKAVATRPPQEREALHGHLSSASLVRLAGAALSHNSVEEAGGSLAEDDIRTVLSYRNPYIPTTVDGQLTGLLDQSVVALLVARTAVARQ